MGPARFAVTAAVAVATVAAAAAAIVPSTDGGPRTAAPCEPQAQLPIVTPAAASWRPGTTGAAGGISFPGDVLVEPDADLARDLDAVVRAGARWVRVDVDWSFVEDRRGVRDWCRPDRVIIAARERGLDVVAVLAYAPSWATGSDNRKAAPRDPADFAAFAGAAVARYAPNGVHSWEVWNEPNIAAFWAPKPDAAGYARLLAAAAPAIRAADPAGTVISAGLAPAPDSDDGRFVNPETYLRALYRLGAADDFDALGYHPYSYPRRPTQEGNAFSRLPDVRALMVANGDAGKEVWLTEFGAPTGMADGAVGDDEQAAILREGYDAVAAYPWAGPMLWYSLRDIGADAASIGENFGLLRQDYEEKPALAAFTEAMAAARAPA